jgi:hypothetical protein
MAKEIELTQGKVAIVDDEDYEWLNQWHWYAAKYGKTFYAARNEGTFPLKKTIYMHCVIMNTPAGMRIDHKDLNGLNNTRNNLRNSTHAQNKQNAGKYSNNTSGYKGVSWHKRIEKYTAQIVVNGKRINLGYFYDLKDAALAYDEAAKKYHGPFAKLNFE